MRLNPEHLITFAHVVNEGGISRAARRLHLTQPALSNQLRQLQDRVGQALYRRAGRGIVLTGAGRHLLVEAQRVVDALAAAETAADTLAGAQSGLLRIAASQTVGAYLLPAIVAAFREDAPAIEVELESHNSAHVLGHLQDFDVSLVEGPQASHLPPHYVTKTLGRDEIVAVVRRDSDVAQRRFLSPRQLAKQPLIWRETGSGTRQQVEQLFRDAGIQPKIRVELAGVAAVKEAVRQGLGIGFASRLALRYDEGPLAGISLRPRLQRALTLVSPNRPTPACRRFLQFLHAAAHRDAPDPGSSITLPRSDK